MPGACAKQLATGMGERAGRRHCSVRRLVASSSRAYAPAPRERDMQISKVTNSGKSETSASRPMAAIWSTSCASRAVWGCGPAKLVRAAISASLAPQPGSFLGITFSRDGRLLYFARGHPTADLYTIPILGGTPRIVLKGVDTPANFSPDGKQFMFVRKDYQRNVAEVR